MDAQDVQSEVYRTRSKLARTTRYGTREEAAEARKEMDKAVLRKIFLENRDKILNVREDDTTINNLIDEIIDIEEQP